MAARASPTDFRPVAWTSVVAKTFWKAAAGICQTLPNRWRSIRVHTKSLDWRWRWPAYRHREWFLDCHPKNYTTCLFIIFSSAFNTISPATLSSQLMKSWWRLISITTYFTYQQLSNSTHPDGHCGLAIVILRHDVYWLSPKLCVISPAVFDLYKALPWTRWQLSCYKVRCWYCCARISESQLRLKYAIILYWGFFLTGVFPMIW